ncbi:MAG: acyloxyacyl hydrolase [Sedimentisphaerales bacterium]|nr:acyloxyacyl hydrolase [Sedimentisphaerales bacterium]
MRGYLIGAIVIGSFLFGSLAWGEEYGLLGGFDDGYWRFEYGGGGSLSTDNQYSDRRGDWCMIGSAVYEWPIHDHITMAIQSQPLLLYHQQRDANQNTESLYGFGLGLNFRLYQIAQEQRGLFGEIGSSFIWTSDHFRNNASRWNFLSGGGVGYKFDEHWEIGARFQHISNAGFESPNSGVNLVAMWVGYSF